MFTRRDFLILSSIAGTGAAFPRPGLPENSYTGQICFFSKHLGENDWTRLAKNVKAIGFGGVDLTVRPAGHVLPEKAAVDLPKAVAVIREQALQVPMITTALLSASDPTARVILSTAGQLSIPFFKPGYYKYKFEHIRKELEKVAADFTQLADLARQYGVQVGFHNHSEYVGAPVWDIIPMIERLDPKWVGYYFDIRHAVAEGGVAAWKIALQLVAPRLKMIALKDFYWEKTSKGWQTRNCPLGRGMVNWNYFFKALAKASFHGPMSLHLEYDIPGSTPAAREENTLAAAKKDLDFIDAHVREAYGSKADRTFL